jgi:NADPH-dependent 2,4-dienoyl-CoA reductase/sulfur reductase-like enzyme
MTQLKRRGVPILHGATVEGFEGNGRLTAVLYRSTRGGLARIACDGAAYGHGLRPESQLAELAGCTLGYDPVQRLHLPVLDGEGRAAERIYVAGDGGRIGGGQAAALSGALAAASLLDDLQMSSDSVDRAAYRGALARLYRFQDGLATAFRWPREQAATLDDGTILCRCENVSVGEVRDALHQALASADSNRVKAVTRCGMGRCQGRYCGAALAELVAAACGRADDELDRLRAQAPVKPLPIALADGSAA